MKIFSRIIGINFILFFIVAAFFPYSYSSKSGNAIQMIDVFMFIWIPCTLLAIFVWIGYAFYHWGTRQFKSNSTKRIWFFVLVIGAMLGLIGQIAYHILVIELGKGLKVDQKS